MSRDNRRKPSSSNRASGSRGKRNAVIAVMGLLVAMVLCVASVASGGLWLFGFIGGEDNLAYGGAG